MPLIQVIIDDSTNKTITGTYQFDSSNGGVFIGSSGASFPASPTAGEWFIRSDEGKLYRRNDANDAWVTIGNTATFVVGPSSSADNAIARFDSTTGKLIQNSSVQIDDDGNIILEAAKTVDGVDVSAHASRHVSGGADSLKLDDLATPDDNTDLDSTTGRHGLLPKLGGGTSNFLRADGAWAAPSGGSGDVVGPSSSTDNAIARFDSTTGKLIQNSSATIDDNGNLYLDVNGSTPASPRIFGATGFSTGEAIRWEFGDGANSIQNSWGGAMALGSYHTLILRGDRNSGTPMAFESTSDIGVWVPNTVLSSPALVVDGASGQTADLQRWRTNAGSTLASVDASGNIVFSSTQTVDGVDVSAHASRHRSGGADSIKLDDLATPDDNSDLNATTSYHGLLPKLGGGSTNFLRADGTWAAPSGSAAVMEAWWEAGNLAQPSSTTGFMYKTPCNGVNDVSSGWSQPLTSPSDDMVNGNIDPIIVPETGKLKEIRIWFAAAAVSTGTVGSPVVRIQFYKVQSDGTGRDLLTNGTVDVPISSTGVGTYNNLGTTSPQSVLYDMTDISVTAGDLIGWQFTNVSGNNNINAISRLKTSVHFVADI